MANKVYNVKEILLADDTEVTLKPLAIGRLRRFMDAWKATETMGKDDDGFDIFINCCGVALEDNFKGKFDTLRADKAAQEKGEFLSEDYKEYLMDTLELDTIYLVLEVAGGIKLNDPKLVEAAMAAQMEQLGTTSTS